MSNALISAKELNARFSEPGLVILDASMQNPLPGTSNKVGSEAIPGSIRFDIEMVFSEPDAHFPHTRSTPESFQKAARKLGINNDSMLVVYDNMGIYSSPRAWWLLKAMGHENVWVLDGGLAGWKQAGFATGEYGEIPGEGNFVAMPEPGFFIDSPELLQKHTEQHIEILDARSPGRFSGQEPEPREGVRSGHIPRAKNLHYRLLTNNGFLQSEEQLTALYQDLQVPMDSTLVFSCGSGITACILALSAQQIGYQRLRVFDGSWAEWGATHSLPIEL